MQNYIKKSFHDFFRRLMGEIYIYFKTNAFVDGIISIKFLVYGLLFVFVSEIIGRSDYLFLTLPEIEQKIENDRQNYDLREVEYILFAIEKIKKNDLGIKFNFFEELEQVSSALS